MLKHRIIQVLLTDGTGQCVKPVAFQRPYRKLGTMEQYLNVIERRNIDELIIIDIEATNQNRKPDFEKLRRYCDNIYCPVTYGGGISTLDDIQLALANGADKVSINKWLIENPGEAQKAIKKFGSQCIVGVVHSQDNYLVELNYESGEYAKRLENLGVGELLLIDIDRDGTMEGYNLKLIKDVHNVTDIPIIALGGCGNPRHMDRAINAGASAAAAGSMFLYTEYTPRSCAEHLKEQGFPVRLDEQNY